MFRGLKGETCPKEAREMWIGVVAEVPKWRLNTRPKVGSGGSGEKDPALFQEHPGGYRWDRQTPTHSSVGGVRSAFQSNGSCPQGEAGPAG